MFFDIINASGNLGRMRFYKHYFIYVLVSVFLMPVVACADDFDLDNALRATYTSCVGIDNELADLKKMAGINTAVTGVGTGLGVGATVVGIVKASKDKQIARLEKELEKLHEIQERRSFAVPNRAELLAGVDAYYSDTHDESKNIEQSTQEEINKLTSQSKKLGNWRTGLMAGNTATNVAGAIIAGNNKIDGDLEAKIKSCSIAVKNLRISMMQARGNGVDVTEANEIINACSEYDYVDISKVNNKAKGALVSSVIGATTGLAGTVTSAMANTDATRNDNSDSGKQKEKNLNTAANILAGTSTVASGVATVFNATEISAIKKVASVAQKCEGVLIQ